MTASLFEACPLVVSQAVAFTSPNSCSYPAQQKRNALRGLYSCWNIAAEATEGHAHAIRVLAPEVYASWLVPTLGRFSDTYGIPLELNIQPHSQLLPTIAADAALPASEQHVVWLQTTLTTQHLADTGTSVDISRLVTRAGTTLDWSSILQTFRLQLASYRGATYAMPLDGTTLYTMARRQVFERLGMQVPLTWAELVDFAASYTQLAAAAAGPGSEAGELPPYPVCLALGASCQRQSLLQAIWASMAQTHGSQQGVHFDTATGTPLLDSPPAQEAFRIMARLLAASAPPEPDETCSHGSLAFARGKCAISLAGHVPQMRMLFLHEYGARVDMRGVQLLPLPGSHVVWVRAAGNVTGGALRPCTAELCPYGTPQPFANGTRIINHSPLSPGTNLAGAANNRQHPFLQYIGYAILEYLASPERYGPDEPAPLLQTVAPVREQYVGPEAVTYWEAAGFDRATMLESFPAMRFTREHPNRAWDLRMPYHTTYDEVLSGIYEGLVNGSVVLDEDASTAQVQSLPLPSSMPPTSPNTSGTGGDADVTKVARRRLLLHGQPSVPPSPPPPSPASHWIPGAPLPLSLAVKQGQAVLAAYYTPAVFLPKYLDSLAILHPTNSSHPATAGTAAASGKSISGLLSVVLSACSVVVCVLAVCGLVAWRRRILRRAKRRAAAGRDWSKRLADASKRGLPAEPVALVVTDIQDSTVLWEALPAAVMSEAVRLHHTAVRRLMCAHGGYESSTEGDSFILAFRSVKEAAAFATELQAQLLLQPWPLELLKLPVCSSLWSDLPEGFPFTARQQQQQQSTPPSEGTPSGDPSAPHSHGSLRAPSHNGSPRQDLLLSTSNIRRVRRSFDVRPGASSSTPERAGFGTASRVFGAAGSGGGPMGQAPTGHATLACPQPAASPRHAHAAAAAAMSSRHPAGPSSLGSRLRVVTRQGDALLTAGAALEPPHTRGTATRGSFSSDRAWDVLNSTQQEPEFECPSPGPDVYGDQEPDQRARLQKSHSSGLVLATREHSAIGEPAGELGSTYPEQLSPALAAAQVHAERAAPPVVPRPRSGHVPYRVTRTVSPRLIVTACMGSRGGGDGFWGGGDGSPASPPSAQRRGSCPQHTDDDIAAAPSAPRRATAGQLRSGATHVSASEPLPQLPCSGALPAETLAEFLDSAASTGAAPRPPQAHHHPHLGLAAALALGVGGNKAPLLLFRGLRVRVGISWATPSASELQYNAAAARMVYGGPCVAAAKAVADMAAGGQVVLSGPAAAQLDEECGAGPGGRPGGAMVMHLGTYAFTRAPTGGQRSGSPSRVALATLQTFGSVPCMDAGSAAAASIAAITCPPSAVATACITPRPSAASEAVPYVSIIVDGAPSDLGAFMTHGSSPQEIAELTQPRLLQPAAAQQPLRQRQPPQPVHADVRSVFWLTSPALSPRLAFMPRLRVPSDATPLAEVYGAPVGRLSYGVVQIPAAPALLAWNRELGCEALRLLEEAAGAALRRVGGRGGSCYMVPGASERGAVCAAFSSSASAVWWALQLRSELLAAPWPQELLAHELCQVVEATDPRVSPRWPRCPQPLPPQGRTSRPSLRPWSAGLGLRLPAPLQLGSGHRRNSLSNARLRGPASLELTTAPSLPVHYLHEDSRRSCGSAAVRSGRRAAQTPVSSSPPSATAVSLEAWQPVTQDAVGTGLASEPLPKLGYGAHYGARYGARYDTTPPTTGMVLTEVADEDRPPPAASQAQAHATDWPVEMPLAPPTSAGEGPLAPPTSLGSLLGEGVTEESPCEAEDGPRWPPSAPVSGVGPICDAKPPTVYFRGPRMRAGVATGSAEWLLHEPSHALSYAGRPVRSAGKLAAAAGPGQVLCDEATRQAALVEQVWRTIEADAADAEAVVGGGAAAAAATTAGAAAEADAGAGPAAAAGWSPQHQLVFLPAADVAGSGHTSIKRKALASAFVCRVQARGREAQGRGSIY